MNGKLGQGPDIDSALVPGQVTKAPSNITEIAVGDFHNACITRMTLNISLCIYLLNYRERRCIHLGRGKLRATRTRSCCHTIQYPTSGML